MEIERKFLVARLPSDINTYPVRYIEQAYLNTEPVIRIRRDNDMYELTYKSIGFLIREEYNLPLTAKAYAHLLSKADGRIIRKKRYMIPTEGNLTIELDIFEQELSPLILAEVEFPDEETAKAFSPPDWFAEDVTFSHTYQNSTLSQT